MHHNIEEGRGEYQLKTDKTLDHMCKPTVQADSRPFLSEKMNGRQVKAILQPMGLCDSAGVSYIKLEHVPIYET
jgi:hypothetical protein